MRFSSPLLASLKHLAIVLIPLVLAANAAAAQSGRVKQPTMDLAATDLRLRIETERTTYHVGDQIRVRLTLVNSSARTILVPPTNAPNMAVLLVYDGAGHKVAPTVPLPLRPFSGPPTRLEPQAEMVLPGPSVAQGEWVSLQDFGYDLKSPGNYAVAGFSRLAPPTHNMRVDADRSMVKHSEVAFTVTP